MWEQLHWCWSTQEWTWLYCTSRFSSCIFVSSCRCHRRFYIAFSDFLVSGLLIASFLETLVGLVTNVPFVFGKASPNNEKDAWSFLSTSEGWPCGHWELSSGATGVDEKLDRDCRTGAPCTTHFSLMFIPDVFVVRFDVTMMPHNECVLAEVLNTFWEIVSDNYWQNLDVNINEFWTDKVFR